MKEIDYIIAELAKWIAYYNEDYRNWSNYSSAILGSMSWKKTHWVLDMEDLLYYGHKMYDVKDLSPLVDELQTTKRGKIKLFHKEYIEQNLEPYLSKVLKGDNDAVSDFRDSIENNQRFFEDYVFDEDYIGENFEYRYGFNPKEWEIQKVEDLYPYSGDMSELLPSEISSDLEDVFEIELENSAGTLKEAEALDESEYVGQADTRLGELQKILSEVSATASNTQQLEKEKIKKMESLVTDEESANQFLVIVDSLSDFYDLTPLESSVQVLINIETDRIYKKIRKAYDLFSAEVDYAFDQEAEQLWEAFVDGSDNSDAIHLIKVAIKEHKMTSEDLLYSMSEKTKIEKFLDLYDVMEHPRLNLFFGKA